MFTKSAVFPAMVCHRLPTPVRHLPARRTFGVLSAYLGIRNSLEVVTGDSTDAAGGAGHPYPKSANSCASAANTMALTGDDRDRPAGAVAGSDCLQKPWTKTWLPNHLLATSRQLLVEEGSL